MKKILLDVESGYSEILIGESIDNLHNYLDNRRTIIITDKNILEHYSSRIRNFDIIEIGIGEEVKNLNTVKFIIEKLIELEADRSVFLLGFGGGVVCDITGLVASVYMRGVSFGFVSTSLLSQVDASIGGKNGVNINDLKNIFGVFNQPEFVLCDITLLKTLPENEYIAGFAEIIKYGLIADPVIIKYIEDNIEKLFKRDINTLYKLISDSVSVKVSIVKNDDKESGLRRILNFGHTIGHAIELNNSLSHGEAVSLGIIKALDISVARMGLDSSIVARIKKLLSKLNLPVNIKFISGDVLNKIKVDKKRVETNIHFILLRELGKTEIVKLSLTEIEQILDED